MATDSLPVLERASPAAPKSTGDRVRGRVFSYNPKEGFGYARLQDNRVVWLDSAHLVESSPQPSREDVVEFTLRSTRNGLEAREIRVISGAEEKSGAATTPAAADGRQAPSGPGVQPPANAAVPAAAEGGRKEITATPATAPKPPAASSRRQAERGRSESRQPAERSFVQPPKKRPPLKGTDRSQGLYQNAATARVEGRIDDARRFFKESIEAGAGTLVYEAYAKMEHERNNPADAIRILEAGINLFPNYANFYVMLGQMRRRAQDYVRAEQVFRQGLKRLSGHVSLRMGLAQTLVQMGTRESLREAGGIFESLEKQSKLNKQDKQYLRFKVWQKSPRANKAYDFFQMAGMRVSAAGRRNLPAQTTDLVVEISSQELGESFGLAGSFLVRCLERGPHHIDLVNLRDYLRGFGVSGVLSLQAGRPVVINSSLAFVAVPDTDAVRDQIMSIMGESSEALVPLDDAMFRSNEEPLKKLRDVLGQYLGMRDLYSSTMPVSGRRFFGRERLFVELADQIQNAQFLGIYGLRKIGKTSLLYQLRDEKLRGEAVAYVDLQASAALTVRNCAPLYWELERDLYVRLRERCPQGAALLRLGEYERFSAVPQGESRAALFFAEDVRALLDKVTAGEIREFRRLVIILDELERILPVGDQPGIDGYLEFFGLLRGLAQTERYRGLLSSVVAAANAAISERGYWEGRENPVFALYKPIFLPPLSEEECAEMIRALGKGMSVYWEDEAIRAVFAETGGHPFLTRLFCSRVARQNPARPLHVTALMVQEQVGPFIRNESDKLEQITELLKINFPQEESFLERIALGEALPEMPDESLRHLLGYQLIAMDGGDRYQLTLNLLHRWLQSRAGVRE